MILAFYGFQYFRDQKIEKRQTRYEKVARVIAEVSVAAELYRNKPDSFLIVRDSILGKYDFSIEQLREFENRLADKKGDWFLIWKDVAKVTDSLVGAEKERIRALADTANTDTLSGSNLSPAE